MPSSGTRARAALAPALLAASLASCANLSVERTSETSGRFRSSGIAFTFLSIDFPRQAILIARENASDMGAPNMQVESTHIVPYLGPLDWILDIISIRYAVITGTFGVTPIPDLAPTGAPTAPAPLPEPVPAPVPEPVPEPTPAGGP